jgi:hypothetical protein
MLPAKSGRASLERGAGHGIMAKVEARNRLMNQIRKVLSVVQRIGLAELRTAVGRHHRMQGFAPPRRVLLEFCRRVPGYRVEPGDFIAIDSPIEWSQTLADTERMLVRVLQKDGPIMEREKLERTCLGLGMDRATFYAYLSYSPLLTRYALGVYGLVGAAVPTGLIDSLAPQRRRGNVLIDYGWITGKLWLGYRISQNMIATGVFGIPAGMKDFLQQDFALNASDGQVIGVLRCRGTSSWGLTPFFSRRGGEAGDYLLIIYDLLSREAAVSIGDASLLDRQVESKEALTT